MTTRRRFFTIMPLQQVILNEDGSTAKNNLKASIYEPVGNSKLRYGATRFPIIPVLHGYAEPEDEIQIIAITPKNSFAEYHLKEFRKEVETVKLEKGLMNCEIISVSVSDAGDVATQIDLFQKLLDFVEDDVLLYGCQTYGNKPMSIAELMAIQYAYRVLNNVTIDCLVYGEINREIKRNFIYDITALIQLDEITRMLAERRVKDPKEIINSILTL